MRRREFLLASIALLPGCLGTSDRRTTKEPTPPTAPTTTSPTATPTWTPGGTGAAGTDSTMLEVSVANAFDGRVALTGTCAGPDDERLEPGETVRYKRESAGDGCAYVVEVNGSERARGGVSGYETVMIDVDGDGNVSVSTLAR